MTQKMYLADAEHKAMGLPSTQEQIDRHNAAVTKWHTVEPRDRARIRCEANCGGGAENCGLPTMACHHAGKPHPFFYYCEVHARNHGWTGA